MPIVFQKTFARFEDTVGVEEAESLATWLQENPKGKIDLRNCNHLHTAQLQLLLAARPCIKAWPRDSEFAALLQRLLFPK